MVVTIFGATGGIGRWAVKHALEKGYDVRAFVRNPQKITEASDRLTIIQGEISDDHAVLEAVRGTDAVIWCVGIPMKRKYDDMASFGGHKVLLKAMQAAGVKRLIDWGTPSIPFSKDKKSFITIVPGIMAGIALTQAKKEMVAVGKMIEESGLEWTLVRFMAPQNTPYTGTVKVGFGDVKMNFAISREDIGAFMVDQVESRKYINSMPIIGK